jgi:hypothetical protein
MRTVTIQDLLDITADDFKQLSYPDANMVISAWDTEGRILGLPDEAHKIQYGDTEAFSAFLSERKAAYYADCRENFSLFKAVQTALDAGVTIVYVEDLS